jgi:iron complex outermembrane receptor protein
MSKRVALAGIAMAGISGIVGAQQPPVTLEEVVVTSRRVEENLQDVPVSITAFTSADLEKQDIRNVRDIAKFTPNMTFTAGETGRSAVPVIRGIGLIDGRGFDNAVGVFIDGIFVSGRAAQNVGMLDLERVEVIKGPQSALYGRNTFSGAINYVTRPTPDEFTAKAEATLGTDELLRFSGSIGGPVTERFGARLAVAYEEDDGTYENAGPLAAGDGIGGGESKSALLSLRFKPTDNFTIDVSGLYSEEFADMRALNILPNNCGQFDPMQNSSATSSDLRNPIYFCGEGQPLGSDKVSHSPEAYGFDSETTRGTLALTWDLGDIEVQSLSAYTTVKSLSQVDLDRTQAGDGGFGYAPLSAYRAAGSPSFICSGFIPAGPCRGTAPLFNQIRAGTFNTYFGANGLDADYWSTELRFTGPRDQRLRWLAGAFYFRSKNDDTTITGIDASAASAALGLPTNQIQFFVLDPGTIIPGLAPRGIAIPSFIPNAAYLNGPGTAVLTYTPLIDEQVSLFGSLEFDFTDQLTGTAELRYTDEDQELSNTYDIFFGSFGTYTTGSSFVDPRFTLRYKPSEDLTIYGSVARGTRSGGLNAAVTEPTLVSFDEETNDTYEIGIKSTLADGRAQLNAAVFYIDWTDAQFRQSFPNPMGGTTLTATTNAGDIESYGAEISFAAKLTDRWSFDIAGGYSDPKFADGTVSPSLISLCRTLPSPPSTFPPIPVTCVGVDLDGNGTIDSVQPDIGGKQLPRTSTVTANLGVEYAQPVFGDSRIVARLDAFYRSKQYGDFTNTNWVPDKTVANFRIGLERENFDVVLWVENLTDEDDLDQVLTTFSQNFNSFSSGSTGVNPTLRRYGITGRYRF